MHEPQEGIWTLTAPDGRQWTGESGLCAAAAEQRERIPPAVQLERIFAEFDLTEGPIPLHPDTEALVQRFAEAMRNKMAKAERKYGYSNLWANSDWMEECRAKLVEHLHKGDPLDVANYCAFLWHHGEHCKPLNDELKATEIRQLRGLLTEAVALRDFPRWPFPGGEETAKKRADLWRRIEHSLPPNAVANSAGACASPGSEATKS